MLEENEFKRRINLFPLKFLLYLIYLLVRAVVQLESDIVAFIRKATNCEKCEVEFFYIVTRFRLDRTDCTRDSDFLLFNESFGSFEEIEGPQWVIYTITEKDVYLVEVEDGECTIDKYSNMADYLHSNATRMCRIKIEEFINKTVHLPTFASRVVFLHSVPCSGATITGRMLQACDTTYRNLQVYGEPPVVTSLSILTASLPIETLRRLTLCSLRFALRHQKTDQTVVYKTRMNSARILPYVHSSCSSVLHCLITTKDLNSSVSRLLKKTSTEAPVFTVISRLLYESEWLCNTVTQWTQMQNRIMKQIGPKNSFEFAASLVVGSSLSYERCMPYFAMDAIFAEDLISETVRHLSPLLDICEMSDLAIPDALDWKRKTENEWKDSQVCSLTEQECERVEHYTELLRGDWNL